MHLLDGQNRDNTRGQTQGPPRIKRVFQWIRNICCKIIDRFADILKWFSKPVIPVRKLNHPNVLSDWLNAIIIESESFDPDFVIFLFSSSGLNSYFKFNNWLNETDCSCDSSKLYLDMHQKVPFLVSIYPYKSDFYIDSQVVWTGSWSFPKNHHMILMTASLYWRISIFSF